MDTIESFRDVCFTNNNKNNKATPGRVTYSINAERLQDVSIFADLDRCLKDQAWTLVVAAVRMLWLLVSFTGSNPINL